MFIFINSDIYMFIFIVRFVVRFYFNSFSDCLYLDRTALAKSVDPDQTAPKGAV